MSRIDLNIPILGTKFVDLRDSLPGDSFNWSWTRSLTSVKYLAIHHTAGPDTQTPVQIANFHINSNGWGGIGYHFLVDKDGVVYYVGDISTARANVANLNDQVIGICLIGSFMGGKEPSSEQLSSVRKLCEFFISNYPELTNLNSFSQVMGHKELPGQSTACPGEAWNQWKKKVTEGGGSTTPPAGGGNTTVPTTSGSDRGAKITESYRKVLGRDPDMGGLQSYTNGPMSVEQIVWDMVLSKEHQDLVSNGKSASDLRNQVDNLQTSLTSINQQVLILQESLKEKDEQIANLKLQPVQPPVKVEVVPEVKKPVDNTVAIADLLINVFKFIFMPGKVVN